MNMKTGKFLILLVCLVGLAKFVDAQDVIVKKDNSTILSKVVEINSTDIKYKKWSNQDGPMYSISRQEVKSINYQNGEVEVISSEQPQQVYVQPEPEPEPTTYQQPEPQPQVVAQQQPIVIKQTETKQPVVRYNRGRFMFSLNAGVSMPLGNFGTVSPDWYCAPFSIFGTDELRTGYGAAKTGVNAAMKLHIPLSNNNHGDILGLVIKGNFMYNGISDEEKRDFRDMLDEMAYSWNAYYNTNAYNYQIDQYASYRNYSLLCGIDYTHYFAKAFALFGEFNVGLNLASISNTVINNIWGNTYVYSADHTNYYSETSNVVSYKTQVNAAVEIGGGLFLADHISIGVFYTYYSPFQVSGTITMSGAYGTDQSTFVSQKLKVSALSLQLGINF